MSSPFLARVPKDVEKNLEWRMAMRRCALEDVELQSALVDACRLDSLFFFNAVCWLFEPRPVPRILPFVTRPNQDRAILAMEAALGRDDLVVIKSRGEGATWIYLMILLRHWLFDPMFAAGLVSRNEAVVDSKEDPDSLMWKLDWTIPRLPFWLQPKGFDPKVHRTYSKHTLLNPENNSTIVGYAATGDVASGGRKTVFVMDEMAKFPREEQDAAMDSTQHVTNSRFLVSTYKGEVGAYYDAATDADSNAVKVVLDWKENPTRNELLYAIRMGKAWPMDPADQPELTKYLRENAANVKKLERKGYWKDGAISSPWRDRECLRAGATPRSIAQEIDMNAKGAVSKVFDVDVLDRMKKDCCRDPVWQGVAVIDEETALVTGLIKSENGPLKLWVQPGSDHSMPRGKYGVGCDISAGGRGEYSSNSVAAGANLDSGEQVFEYTINGMMAIKFARVCVALCRCFGNAYLGWEATGPTGIAFEDEVLEQLHYYNVYYRTVRGIGGRPQKKPGWWNGSDADKGLLFEQFCVDMDEKRITPRSMEMIGECGEYEWDGDGKIVHTPTSHGGITTGKAHGDRCVAGGVMSLLCRDRGRVEFDTEEEKVENPPYGSWAWREARDQSGRHRWTDNEPQPTLSDVLRF